VPVEGVREGAITNHVQPLVLRPGGKKLFDTLLGGESADEEPSPIGGYLLWMTRRRVIHKVGENDHALGVNAILSEGALGAFGKEYEAICPAQ
jgi:hypothetical protein